MKSGVKKLQSMCYSVIKPGNPTVISFELIPACDGHMDRQTDGQAAYS